MASRNTIDECRTNTIDILSNTLHCNKCGAVNEYSPNVLNGNNQKGQLDNHLKELFKTFTVEKCDNTIKILNEVKRNITKADKDKQMIITAAKTGDLDTVKKCVDSKIDINYTDATGSSAMHAAAQCGNNELIKYLIRQGGDVKIKNKKFDTPLHIAAQFGHAEIVKIFIKKGVFINVLNKTKNTPLHLAATYNHANVVSELLRNYAKSDIINNFNLTPIMCTKNEDVILEFVYGNVINDEDKIDLLFKAIEKNWVTTFKKLINLSVNVNSQKRDNTLDSPIIFAARHGRVQFVKMLLDAGGHINYENNLNESVLDIATKNSNQVLVDLLKKYIGQNQENRIPIRFVRSPKLTNVVNK